MAKHPIDSPDLARIRYGTRLILAAFGLLATVFLVAVWQFTTAADVSAAVGAVAGVVGTIVGAFFGAQIGSSGKETAEAGWAQAENGRVQAERAARTALAKLQPDDAAEVMRLMS
jgi:hypothetical protein